MAVLDILQFGDDILREKSTEVADFNEELWELLDDMAETMYEAGGVGLAAPQVGVLKRVVVIDTDDDHGLLELINPVIVAIKGKQRELESCLSYPGRSGYVERPANGWWPTDTTSAACSPSRTSRRTAASRYR